MKKILSPIILIILVLGCAKRNTAYQQENYLKLDMEIPVMGNPKDMYIAWNKVFIAEDQCGFSIIDLNNYQRDWYINLIDHDGGITQLIQTKKIVSIPSLEKLLLYETEGSDGIIVVDTSQDTLKLEMVVIGGTANISEMRFAAIPNPNNEFIFDGYLSENRKIHYGAYNNNSKLWTTFREYNAPGSISGFDLDGQYLYATMEQMGLIIFNKQSGNIVGQLDLPGEAQKIKIYNGYAYVVCRESGLQIIDISNILNPVLVSGYETEGYATSIDVYNDLAIVSSGSGGVYLFDIHNPQQPLLKQNITESGYTNVAKFYDNKVFIAGRNSGISIYSH